MSKILSENKLYYRIILTLSVVIPVVVAVLLFTPLNLGMGSWVKQLPFINALLNSSTAILLAAALAAVKTGKINAHKNLMLSAIILGALFLVSYVIYHSNTTSVKFGDLDHDGILSAEELGNIGGMRTTYLIILLTHIVFSAIVIPLVLFSAYYSLTGQISKHRRLVRYSYPIWMYVSVTGVTVYLLISPYY